MHCILSPSLDPYYNLAMEEYFLKNSSDEFFILYRNENSIIVGKHQVTYAEINNSFARVNNIKVGRRISGGGAVYHDSGNINFSFLLNRRSDEDYNFKSIAEKVISALRTFEIDSEIEGKNNLILNGRKFSGNSSHVFRNRVLHHGTLLFDANLDYLRQSLIPDNKKYIHNKIHSIPGHVMNLSSVISSVQDKREFMMRLLEVFLNMPGNSDYFISETDHIKIIELADNKYAKPEWIYSYQGDYEFQNSFELEGQNQIINLTVLGGRISNTKLNISLCNTSINDILSERLLDSYHRFEEVSEIFSGIDNLGLNKTEIDSLVNEFF